MELPSHQKLHYSWSEHLSEAEIQTKILQQTKAYTTFVFNRTTSLTTKRSITIYKCNYVALPSHQLVWFLANFYIKYQHRISQQATRNLYRADAFPYRGVGLLNNFGF